MGFVKRAIQFHFQFDTSSLSVYSNLPLSLPPWQLHEKGLCSCFVLCERTSASEDMKKMVVIESLRWSHVVLTRRSDQYRSFKVAIIDLSHLMHHTDKPTRFSGVRYQIDKGTDVQGCSWMGYWRSKSSESKSVCWFMQRDKRTCPLCTKTSWGCCH